MRNQLQLMVHRPHLGLFLFLVFNEAARDELHTFFRRAPGVIRSRVEVLSAGLPLQLCLQTFQKLVEWSRKKGILRKNWVLFAWVRLRLKVLGVRTHSIKAWSHGDPTSPDFPTLLAVFGSETPLILVDDGAASRFFPEVRQGKHFSFFPSEPSPAHLSGPLSRESIRKVVFFSHYSAQVSGKDEIWPQRPHRVARKRDASSRDEIWLAGAPLTGPAADKYVLRLAERLIKKYNSKVYYLPHPKEHGERIQRLSSLPNLTLPDWEYTDFESFLEKRGSPTDILFSFASTVIDVWSQAGFPMSNATLIRPHSAALPYPDFTRNLEERLLIEYPLLKVWDHRSTLP